MEYRKLDTIMSRICRNTVRKLPDSFIVSNNVGSGNTVNLPAVGRSFYCPTGQEQGTVRIVGEWQSPPGAIIFSSFCPLVTLLNLPAVGHSFLNSSHAGGWQSSPRALSQMIFAVISSRIKCGKPVFFR